MKAKKSQQKMEKNKENQEAQLEAGLTKKKDERNAQKLTQG